LKKKKLYVKEKYDNANKLRDINKIQKKVRQNDQWLY